MLQRGQRGLRGTAALLGLFHASSRRPQLLQELGALRSAARPLLLQVACHLRSELAQAVASLVSRTQLRPCCCQLPTQRGPGGCKLLLQLSPWGIPLLPNALQLRAALTLPAQGQLQLRRLVSVANPAGACGSCARPLGWRVLLVDREGPAGLHALTLAVGLERGPHHVFDVLHAVGGEPLVLCLRCGQLIRQAPRLLAELVPLVVELFLQLVGLLLADEQQTLEHLAPRHGVLPAAHGACVASAASGCAQRRTFR
mmetsp:Transcript_49456/g.158235  ORF Transcript_49456/g.158235 Transcript_49456/m.158235 type:complete len:256 (+) Transcript_49456:1028-1795(+)